MKKVGILTFHHSHNCGSMLESYAMQHFLEKMGIENELINFSNEGQRKLYAAFFEYNTVKNIIKNVLIFPHKYRIMRNYSEYEAFMNQNFRLSKPFYTMEQLEETAYDIVIAGSDQIWNITIQDGDDAYFLPWVGKAKRIAYAPSFGAKNIMQYAADINKYSAWINSFDALSVREYNGLKWIRDLTGREAELLPDPTLMLDAEDYRILMNDINLPKKKYLFFYCPSFQRDICRFVKKIAYKYQLQVITWSTKSYYTRAVYQYGFKLPEYESPSMYLSLMEHAELIITTSFHGSIFSTIFRKRFFVIRCGDMCGNDDRVWTFLLSYKLTDRLISCKFDKNQDYMRAVDYTEYEKELPVLQKKAFEYIKKM